MRSTIQRLVSNGHCREALLSYAAAPQPTDFTFPFLLKACGILQWPSQTQQIHTHTIKTGFQSHIYTATALINAYMKVHLLEDALKVFETIPNPTLPALNAVISGFSQTDDFQESLYAFKRIEREGFLPNSVTIATVLPACQTIQQAAQLHSLSIKLGHESDVYVATAFITMYSNCGQVGSAQSVFRVIHEKSIVNYNAMIAGFLRNGCFLMALDLFREMGSCFKEQPNSSTLLSLLCICSKMPALVFGKQIHCYLLKCEAKYHVMIGSALVDMYSKCGLLRWAYCVFAQLDNRNLVTWNSMISGLLSHGSLDLALQFFYKLRSEGLRPDSATWNLMINQFARHGHEDEAFRIFTEMQFEGMVRPSSKTITSILQACSSLSHLQHGKEIHCHAIRTEANCDDELLCTALIHMYMSCGCSLHARRIFDGMERKSGDPVLWNAVISGYGRNGENDSALEIFREMQEHNVKPNSATFVSVLSACGHTGQVEKGQEVFTMMNKVYGIKPKIEHLGSLIDLLGRAGKLMEAWNLIKEVPEPSTSMYYSLLGACRWYSDSELGRVVAARISELEPGSPTHLVILSNIFAGQERWNDVENLRKGMSERGLSKFPGCSWGGVKEIAV